MGLGLESRATLGELCLFFTQFIILSLLDLGWRMSTRTKFSDSSSDAETYDSDSSVSSSSSEENPNTQADLQHLLNRARTNLSTGDGNNLALNEDIVKLDSDDEDGER